MKFMSWFCCIGFLIICFIGGYGVGCSPASTNTDASNTQDHQHNEAILSTIPDGLNIVTNQETKGQTYKVSYQPMTSDKKIPLNELFDLHIKVSDTKGQIAKQAGIMVNACMPDHNHCMFVQPGVEKISDGEFKVKGMKFHMQGHWEIYVDVTDGKMGEKQCGRTCSCTSGDCALFNVWMEF